ncbi:MAG: helix-turn-helix domain-containing protein [Candidatus Dormibacteraceae bacterium]
MTFSDIPAKGEETEMTFADAPDVLKVPEVSELLRINRDAAYQLIKSGQIYSARIGHSIRVPKASLERFLLGTEIVEEVGRAQ